MASFQAKKLSVTNQVQINGSLKTAIYLNLMKKYA
jgi:hypothetical protein